MNRRKGTPCGCDSDPCGCSPRSQCIKTINGQYPDANHEFGISAGDGIEITPDGNGIQIGMHLASPMVFRGTVGTGGTVATLPQANGDNLGWTYVAVSSGSTPDTPPKSYAVGDMMVSNGVEWTVIPAGDDPVTWSQITGKPTTVSGYGITDAITGTGNIGTDTKPIKIVNGVATAVTNDLVDVSSAQIVGGAKTFTGLMKASGQGTYDASDTTRVVTIGSLQASSDVVHRTGNEDINGSKSFTSALQRKQNFDANNNIVLLNTSL